MQSIFHIYSRWVGFFLFCVGRLIWDGGGRGVGFPFAAKVFLFWFFFGFFLLFHSLPPAGHSFFLLAARSNRCRTMARMAGKMLGKMRRRPSTRFERKASFFCFFRRGLLVCWWSVLDVLGKARRRFVGILEAMLGMLMKIRGIPRDRIDRIGTWRYPLAEKGNRLLIGWKAFLADVQMILEDRHRFRPRCS